MVSPTIWDLVFILPCGRSKPLPYGLEFYTLDIKNGLTLCQAVLFSYPTYAWNEIASVLLSEISFVLIAPSKLFSSSLYQLSTVSP